jgi:hypothetical protein
VERKITAPADGTRRVWWYDENAKELTPMTEKTSKAKRKRLSKGQRKHVRRLKQAARKAGAPIGRPGHVT